MKMLLNSPAVVTLRWVQRQFPVFKSPGVYDSAPLMNSPFSGSGSGFSALADAETRIVTEKHTSEVLTQR
jgi:nitrous oxidase accessory protein